MKPFAKFSLISQQVQLYNCDPVNVIKVASSISAQHKFIIKLSHCLRSCLLLLEEITLSRAQAASFTVSQVGDISWQSQPHLDCSVWLDSASLSLLGKGEGQKHLWHNTGSDGSNYLVHNNHHVWNAIKIHLRHVFWVQHMHIRDNIPPFVESPLFLHRNWL